MKEAYENGNGATIKMSTSQLRYIMKIEREF